MVRIAAFSDPHGNLPALEAVRKSVDAARPDYVAICGDLAMNGPDPAGTVDLVRELERSGAFVTLGNTDLAVTDGDYAAAFPWFSDGVPDAHVMAAEWARDELGDDRVDWLRRLPSERRLRVDDKLVLFCTHIPEVREIGWRTIVNDGSAGYIFDGDPTASWALIDIEDGRVKAEIQRVSYDVMAAANSVSARGLPGDVYRAATIRTGKLVR